MAKLVLPSSGAMQRLATAAKAVERARLQPNLATDQSWLSPPGTDETIPFKNTSGSDIPEGGLVRLVDVGTDDILEGVQPDAAALRDVVVATAIVPNSSYGRGYNLSAPCKIAMVTTVGVTIGDVVGTTDGAWTAQLDPTSHIQVLAVIDGTYVLGMAVWPDAVQMTNADTVDCPFGAVVWIRTLDGYYGPLAFSRADGPGRVHMGLAAQPIAAGAKGWVYITGAHWGLEPEMPVGGSGVPYNEWAGPVPSGFPRQGSLKDSWHPRTDPLGPLLPIGGPTLTIGGDDFYLYEITRMRGDCILVDQIQGASSVTSVVYVIRLTGFTVAIVGNHLSIS